MQRFDLSTEVKPRDEFTQHNSTSLNLIQEAIAKLEGVDKNSSNYNKLAIMAGSILSSTGNIDEAENLFLKAKDLAQSDADKALACFNLFQVRVRCGTYPEALPELQTAISIDPHYALHEVEKYPIEGLLGAGGMGCVFLCHDEWRENQVVVKCFWEGKKGKREEVFKEVLIMRNLKSPYVPKTLSYGYVDAAKQERPYFVTEYIEDALDGESWLAQYGKLTVDTGLMVGLQVAEGLEIAHKAGVYHLDLKPANLLLKKEENKIAIKIIDFGLARVATSLRQQAAMTQTRSGKSQLTQAVFGTLDYAPPEQLGEIQYGQPGVKSDVFAFGATLYRLLTDDSPRFPHPRKLPDLPELQYLLLDCLEVHPDKRPDVEVVIERLSGLLKELTSEKEISSLKTVKEIPQNDFLKNEKPETEKTTPEETTPKSLENAFSRIQVIKGDIVQQSVDAIVNPTNNHFSGSGGVDYMVHKNAGSELREECKQLKVCAIGDARITKGYNLPAQFVIHTVGPVWKGGHSDEQEILAKCYYNCLTLAEKQAIKTIAFSAISTGTFGFPVKLAAKIALHEVSHFLITANSIEKVIFVCTQHTYGDFQTALNALKQGKIEEKPDTQQSDEVSHKHPQDKSIEESFNPNEFKELCYYAKELGDYKEAITYCDKVLQIKPDYAIAWYNKACYYAIQEQIEQALPDLQKAISLNPKYKELAKTDADFDKIRHDARFQALLSEQIEGDKQPGAILRDKLQDGSEGPKMVVILAGTFRMGDIQGTGNENEQPVHEVFVESFAIGCYTITFAEYDKFAEAIGKEKPDDWGWGRDNRPVINVNWYDAIAYAEWLSQQTGQQYRLPTEAEWEYAARANTETDYWWGNNIGENCANFDGSGNQWGNEMTAPVGSFEPNSFGLYDTVGNVFEWTCSEYEELYNGKEQHCVNEIEDDVVRRGGSWCDEPAMVRVAFRQRYYQSSGNSGVGFRVVRKVLRKTDKAQEKQKTQPGIINRIQVIKGDITQQKVDAIVNPTDTDLSGSGIVDFAIHRAAGQELHKACQQLGTCATGEAKMTDGYKLPARFVIHTVGPFWEDGNSGEHQMLAECYCNCLLLAKENRVKTIAFPSISAGGLGFPVELAAKIAVHEVGRFLMKNTSIEQVILVCTESTYDHFQAALEEQLKQLQTWFNGRKSNEKSQVKPAGQEKSLQPVQISEIQSKPLKRKQKAKPKEVFRDELQDSSEGPELVVIPAGRFRMGDIQGTGLKNEHPLSKKSLMGKLLSKKEKYEDYWVSVKVFGMGRYPVTFAEYDQFAEATGRKKPDDRGWGRSNQPVILVSWADAIAYTEWLSQQTGKRYRLPTEAEWEYAARAGTKTDYWWGNKIGINLANCRDSDSQWSGQQTAPVGSFKPNPFGLYDTVGNVWEWTCSAYEEKYNGDEQRCANKNDGRKRVIRGGSWGYKPEMARVSFRGTSGKKYIDVGFRLLRENR
ncbi:SUMF1/EgtB/PvdO family nonheme iron enzyme [Candidatus Parabeggiatoa sp. HSG14]|uniref:SUMF1/EgtB/PvdO family nonheme iron enzyme n=1 Tax=Candidatus Parabeggiatoa sp. HSG14 TaxID=3055593 RepID=UPI0025A74E52|nr:SUMF1/EgtB/PvdO family nonheme iron enzyme [Thiotrichales bacterium HSG14]